MRDSPSSACSSDGRSNKTSLRAAAARPRSPGLAALERARSTYATARLKLASGCTKPRSANSSRRSMASVYAPRFNASLAAVKSRGFTGRGQARRGGQREQQCQEDQEKAPHRISSAGGRQLFAAHFGRVFGRTLGELGRIDAAVRADEAQRVAVFQQPRQGLGACARQTAFDEGGLQFALQDCACLQIQLEFDGEE